MSQLPSSWSVYARQQLWQLTRSRAPSPGMDRPAADDVQRRAQRLEFLDAAHAPCIPSGEAEQTELARDFAAREPTCICDSDAWVAVPRCVAWKASWVATEQPANALVLDDAEGLSLLLAARGIATTMVSDSAEIRRRLQDSAPSSLLSVRSNAVRGTAFELGVASLAPGAPVAPTLARLADLGVQTALVTADAAPSAAPKGWQLCWQRIGEALVLGQSWCWEPPRALLYFRRSGASSAADPPQPHRQEHTAAPRGLDSPSSMRPAGSAAVIVRLVGLAATPTLRQLQTLSHQVAKLLPTAAEGSECWVRTNDASAYPSVHCYDARGHALMLLLNGTESLLLAVRPAPSPWLQPALLLSLINFGGPTTRILDARPGEAYPSVARTAAGSAARPAAAGSVLVRQSGHRWARVAVDEPPPARVGFAEVAATSARWLDALARAAASAADPAVAAHLRALDRAVAPVAQHAAPSDADVYNRLVQAMASRWLLQRPSACGWPLPSTIVAQAEAVSSGHSRGALAVWEDEALLTLPLLEFCTQSVDVLEPNHAVATLLRHVVGPAQSRLNIQSLDPRGPEAEQLAGRYAALVARVSVATPDAVRCVAQRAKLLLAPGGQLWLDAPARALAPALADLVQLGFTLARHQRAFGMHHDSSLRLSRARSDWLLLRRDTSEAPEPDTEPCLSPSPPPPPLALGQWPAGKLADALAPIHVHELWDALQQRSGLVFANRSVHATPTWFTAYATLESRRGVAAGWTQLGLDRTRAQVYFSLAPSNAPLEQNLLAIVRQLAGSSLSPQHSSNQDIRDWAPAPAEGG